MKSKRFNIPVDPVTDVSTISFEDENPMELFQTHFSYGCDLVSQTIEKTSSNVLQVLGYTPEEFESRQFFDVYHPEDRDALQSMILEGHNHLLAKREISVLDTQLTLTGRMRHKDGSYKHVQHLLSYSVLSANGFGVKILNVVTDISNIPFQKITGHLKCGCMEIGTNFSSLQSSSSPFSYDLTRRELEILKHLYLGKSSKEISDELCISKHTVDKHRGNMLTKVGVGNTPELISRVLASGTTFGDHISAE